LFTVDGKILSRHAANAVLRQAGIAKQFRLACIGNLAASAFRKTIHKNPAARDASKLGAELGWGGAFGPYRPVGEVAVLDRADPVSCRESSKRVQCGEPSSLG